MEPFKWEYLSGGAPGQNCVENLYFTKCRVSPELLDRRQTAVGWTQRSPELGVNSGESWKSVPWMSIHKYTCTSLWKQSWVSSLSWLLWSHGTASLTKTDDLKCFCISRQVPPNLYHITFLWRVCPQGTLEWHSQDTEPFVEGSGMLCPTVAPRKLPASSHSQHTHSWAQSLVFLPGFHGLSFKTPSSVTMMCLFPNAARK